MEVGTQSMPNLTICIPVGLYHLDVAHRAIESVRVQTYPCELITVYDHNQEGVGVMRNRALAQCETDFIAFLDADDTIDPSFAAICMDILEHYAASGRTAPRYVYSDWIGVENIVHKAPDPCDAWRNKTSHLVTTVMPTDRARAIGGFDEVMTGVEDADFYIRLILSGVCGIHVNAPLVSYREGGQRSIQARQSGAEALAQQYMSNRYGGYAMGCCGDSTQHDLKPENEPEDGDVLAQAQWSGNMQRRGLASGRLYKRTSYPKLLYIDKRDIQAAPHHWKEVATPMQAANGVILQPQYQTNSSTPWQQTAEAIFGGGQPQPVQAPIEYKPHTSGRSKAETVKKAAEWTKIEGSEL